MDEKRLISLYNKALEDKDEKLIIATSLRLAEFYYENKNMRKAKSYLLKIKKRNRKIRNLFLYLGLIELYYGNNEKAQNYLEEELKYNPKNSFAKQLYDKIIISSRFPYATLMLAFLFSVIFFIFSFEMSFSQKLIYGVSLNNLSLASLVTSIFSHVSIFHFLINLFILLSIGGLVERYIGTFQFSVFFILSGIVANITQVLLGDKGAIVVGPSGALFGIMGILLMQQPLMKMRVFGLFSVPVIFLFGGFFTISYFMLEYFNLSAEIAHMLGLFTGIIYAGIRYSETINVFYYWIFITFGIFMFVVSLYELIFNPSNFLVMMYYALFAITGVLVMTIPYIQLKNLRGVING